MHYYKHHIGDFRAGSRNMSWQERAVYRELIDEYYDTETPLPLDVGTVCRKVGARDAEMQAAVTYVLAEKFTREADGYRHARCDIEIAEYHANAEKNRANGSLGGRPKKPKANRVGTQSEPSGLPVGTQSQPTGKATNNQEPETTNEEPEDHSPGAIAPSPQGDKTAKRGTRLPDDWKPKRATPADYRDIAPGIDVRSEIDQFKDHWRAASGRTATKLDWEAAFRNWLRMAQERAPRSTNGAAPARSLTPSERIRANIAQHFASNASHQALGHDEGEIIDVEVIE
jgi:uncharacterized protein YdaU (DUF1376 family)